MKRLALAVCALALPGLALAEEAMETYKFEPSSSLSTLGLVYTLAMVGLFLGVGWYFKRRAQNSDDYFTAGRGVGALSNGLAMTSNYMSLATFLGFTALLWKLQCSFIRVLPTPRHCRPSSCVACAQMSQ